MLAMMKGAYSHRLCDIPVLLRQSLVSRAKQPVLAPETNLPKTSPSCPVINRDSRRTRKSVTQRLSNTASKKAWWKSKRDGRMKFAAMPSTKCFHLQREGTLGGETRKTEISGDSSILGRYKCD
jgi:hypothetical protein